MKAGDTVLIHAAAGGGGSILVQWAKAPRRQRHRHRRLRGQGRASPAGIGADHVILYDDAGRGRPRYAGLTDGKGVPVAYDSVGGRHLRGHLGQPGGGAACWSASATPRAPSQPFARLGCRGRLAVLAPGPRCSTTPPPAEEPTREREARVRGHQVRPGEKIGQTVALADARRAHEALEGRETVGASLLIELGCFVKQA